MTGFSKPFYLKFGLIQVGVFAFIQSALGHGSWSQQSPLLKIKAQSAVYYLI